MKTKRLVEERHNDTAGYSAWAISRSLCTSWYRVEYWTQHTDETLSHEFYGSEELFNWIERFENKHKLSQ